MKKPPKPCFGGSDIRHGQELFVYKRSPRFRWNEPPSDLGLAFETEIVRPSALDPSRSFIAFSAASSAISTKANPLDLPVSLSNMTFADVTSPNLPNIDFNCSSVTWKPRFDTYKFIIKKLID